jgi:muramoyltetrapeptide carboxypeptidase
MKVDDLSRRNFIAGAALASAWVATSHAAETKPLIKPAALRLGDTIGLIAPASPVFEPSDVREGVRAMEKLGFRVRTGKHIAAKTGYLAGSDRERAQDVMEMFMDPEVKAIVALRGGYGAIRLLPYLDFEIIRKNAKIMLGYSDITTLHLAIHKMAGIVTFHGAVALSTFNEYSTRYLLKTLTQITAVGLVDDPPAALPMVLPNRNKSKRVQGALVGGNLTLVCASLATPWEIDTTDKVLFLEEVGEEPYSLDRMLTQLDQAGKLSCCKAIVLDRCAKCAPAEYKPAFYNTLSVEEVISDRLAHLDVAVLYGLSFGHVADKPVLPLGVQAAVDMEKKSIEIIEAAVE